MSGLDALQPFPHPDGNTGGGLDDFCKLWMISPRFVLIVIGIGEVVWMISPSFVLVLMETQEVVWMLTNLCLILMGMQGVV